MINEEKSNAERFLDAYASIESSLNRILGKVDYVNFSILLKQGARANSVVKNHLSELKEYAELRNAIVHQRGNHEEIIAQPSDSVTITIERIAYLLEKDQRMLNFATTPVKYAYMDTTQKQLLDMMLKSHTTKIPVYGSEGFCGLATMETIAKNAMNGKTDLTAADLIDRTKDNRVVFFDKTQKIQAAIFEFDEAMSSGRAAPIILITENGKMTEKPMGIISSFDLARIITALS
ncbi:MAG: hypothetical protein K6D03_12700 [Solobacterium sp.]|nr:hypothetical protein [Solobacterium sp.]